MLVPRQEYSRELKIACMPELDSGKGLAEVARQYQLSPKRLETWKGEWHAKGELAFPGKGARPQAQLARQARIQGTLLNFPSFPCILSAARAPHTRSFSAGNYD